MTAVQLLGVVGTVVGVVSAIAAVALFARGAYAQARIAELRAVLSDERDLAASLRVQKIDLEREHSECQIKMREAEREVEVLRRVPELAVARVVAMIREDRENWWQVHLAEWNGQIVEAIDKVRTELRGRGRT